MAKATASCLAATVLLLACSAASAKFVQAPEVPVQRLIKNVGAYVQENPKDPQGYYLLGRINALAFDRRCRTVRAFERPGRALPGLDPFQGVREAPEKPLTKDELGGFCRDAVANLEKAIQLKPTEGLYHLGLAWVLQRSLGFAAARPASQPASRPVGSDAERITALIARLDAEKFADREAAEAELKTLMPAAESILLEARKTASAEAAARIDRILAARRLERAIKQYRLAYELAIAADLKIRFQPIRGLHSLVGYEAGSCWLQLAGGRGIKPAEAELKAKIEADLKTLRGKPRGPITPIVFCLDARPRELKDLIAPNAAVRFDLDGSGRPQRWQWVRPNTALLVWDPNGRGRITSGKQLFGSVTWWMFWRERYQPRHARDEQRHRRPAGGKRAGGPGCLFDRNGNGVSDAGEVLPLPRLGVRALSVRATGKAADGSPSNPAGLTLSDGRQLPTYDWLAQPAGNAPTPPASKQQ
jgi:hypothetical protein